MPAYDAFKWLAKWLIECEMEISISKWWILTDTSFKNLMLHFLNNYRITWCFWHVIMDFKWIATSLAYRNLFVTDRRQCNYSFWVYLSKKKSEQFFCVLFLITDIDRLDICFLLRILEFFQLIVADWLVFQDAVFVNLISLTLNKIFKSDVHKFEIYVKLPCWLYW